MNRKMVLGLILGFVSFVFLIFIIYLVRTSGDTSSDLIDIDFFSESPTPEPSAKDNEISDPLDQHNEAFLAMCSPVDRGTTRGSNEPCGTCHPAGPKEANGTSVLCRSCHQGPSNPEYEEWNISAHANTNHVTNANTYCAKCMSPYQYETGTSESSNNPVTALDWDSVSCQTCHDQHSTGVLALYNVTGRKNAVSVVSDLCVGCHELANNQTYVDWNASLHASSTVGCDSCHHPHSLGPTIHNGTAYVEVANTTSSCGPCHNEPAKPLYDRLNASKHFSSNIGCEGCHAPHSLELSLLYGAQRLNFMNATHLCGSCHNEQSELLYDQWNSSGHAPEEIGCGNCHDPHSEKLGLFNGTDHVPVSNITALCGPCHNEPAHPIYDQWNATGHATDNISCNVCHEPHTLELGFFNGTNHIPASNTTALCGPCHNEPTHPLYDKWNASGHSASDISCNVCHDPHTLEVAFFNGTGHIPTADVAELCGPCHNDGAQRIYDNWNASGHSGTNLECSYCHDPHSSELSQANGTQYTPVNSSTELCGPCHNGPAQLLYDEWNSSAHQAVTNMSCTLCHTPHSLELKVYNGMKYVDVDTPSDLCGFCHDGPDDTTFDQWSVSAHADTFQEDNGNTYCAHCMSPFQADPAANETSNEPITEGEWTDISCTVCHDPHNQELMLFNGTEYVEVADISRDLCGGCHQRPHYSNTDEWNSSAHANTYQGFNDNTYCAHCMSPFQYDGAVNKSSGVKVGADNWTGIGCTVCHNPHSLELQFYNGTDYEDPVTSPADLCFECHQGESYPSGDEWAVSLHANSYGVEQGNTYCSRCHSPFNFEYWFDDDETIKSDRRDNNKPVAEEDWQNIGCTVCHDEHSLALGVVVNGSFEEVERSEISEKLCGQCHSGSHGHHKQYNVWNESNHCDTDNGFNGKTYSDKGEIPDGNWTSIGCTVCHNPHSLEVTLYNGVDYQEVTDISRDLCGECHGGPSVDWNGSAHANSYHGFNGNEYCAHCMSPLQGDPEIDRENAADVDISDWEGVGCLVCHDKHSLELVLYDGSDYQSVDDISSDLCGACHQGDKYPETEDWSGSAHAFSYDEAYGNTYCAHCMSPFQYDEGATDGSNEAISEEDWVGIGCSVCHEPHSLELSLYNGTAYKEVSSVSELCGGCHQRENNPIYEDWNGSAHANSYHGFNSNSYCAHCKSPFDFDDGASFANNTVISEENWTAIGCAVCHHPHSLEPVLYNGTDYKTVNDISEDLCGACHSMGDARPGSSPHQTQLEHRKGTGAIGVEDVQYKPYVACEECHMHENDHSLEANKTVCRNCHVIFEPTYSNESLAEDIDFLHTEFDAFFSSVEANLTLVEDARFAGEATGAWTSEMEEIYLRAKFNFEFAGADGSRGMHNPWYSKAVLNKSNQDLDIIIGLLEDDLTLTVSPRDGATGVSIDTVITITFSEDIDFDLFKNNGSIEMSDSTTGKLSYDPASYTITFAPETPLDYQKTYSVTLFKDVRTKTGDPILIRDLVWSFTTEAEPMNGTFTVRVGPVLGEDGDPEEGVEITFWVNGVEYTGVTGSDGFATFTEVPFENIPPGTKVRGTKKNLEDIEWNHGDDIPNISADEERASISPILLAILALLAVLIIIMFVLTVITRLNAARQGRAGLDDDVEE